MRCAVGDYCFFLITNGIFYEYISNVIKLEINNQKYNEKTWYIGRWKIHFKQLIDQRKYHENLKMHRNDYDRNTIFLKFWNAAKAN